MSNHFQWHYPPTSDLLNYTYVFIVWPNDISNVLTFNLSLYVSLSPPKAINFIHIFNHFQRCSTEKKPDIVIYLLNWFSLFCSKYGSNVNLFLLPTKNIMSFYSRNAYNNIFECFWKWLKQNWKCAACVNMLTERLADPRKMNLRPEQKLGLSLKSGKQYDTMYAVRWIKIRRIRSSTSFSRRSTSWRN